MAARKRFVRKVFLLILEEFVNWVDAVLAAVPGRTGVLLRGIYFRLFMNVGGSFYAGRGLTVIGKKNITIGNSVRIMDNSRLYSERGKIAIGNNSAFNTNVVITANDGIITIGNDVLIGNNVLIRAANHVYRGQDKLIRLQGHEKNEILIGDNVWIGGNCVILPGTKIASRVVISAGSTIRGVLEENSIYSGNPAVKIKNI